MRILGLGLAAVVVLVECAGCAVDANGPPHIDLDRTACAHCGMLVSEPVFAAAYQPAGLPARILDDIGCLLDEARRDTAADTARVWVHDATSGAWMDARDAVFMQSPTLRTPMNGGLMAFRDLAAADQAARAHGGHVVRSFVALLADHGKEDPR
jgi:copper chaperone NosL